MGAREGLNDPPPNPRFFARMQLCGPEAPDPVDSGGFLTHAGTEVNRRENPVHTHAVQPSYSCARLSRFVASLMT